MKREEQMELDGKENYIIEWSYPEIYKRDQQSFIEIGLSHTRAADSIRIKYDSERDGYVIEQASTFSWDADDETMDSDWQEVSFIPAWQRKKEDPI